MPNDLDSYWRRLARAPDMPIEQVPVAEMMARFRLELRGFGALVAEQSACLTDVAHTLPRALASLEAGDVVGAWAELNRLLGQVAQCGKS